MLQIRRSPASRVVFSLSGQIGGEELAELQRLLSVEEVGRDIVFDLREVTLVDRDAVKFLARCKAERILLENCPAFIREWIEAERA
jgi:hypothetical protein